jgi:hypothetical protein
VSGRHSGHKTGGKVGTNVSMMRRERSFFRGIISFVSCTRCFALQRKGILRRGAYLSRLESRRDPASRWERIANLCDQGDDSLRDKPLERDKASGEICKVTGRQAEFGRVVEKIERFWVALLDTVKRADGLLSLQMSNRQSKVVA